MASTDKAKVEALAQLKEQFDQWRAARRKGEKIPAAAHLAMLRLHRRLPPRAATAAW